MSLLTAAEINCCFLGSLSLSPSKCKLIPFIFIYHSLDIYLFIYFHFTFPRWSYWLDQFRRSFCITHMNRKRKMQKGGKGLNESKFRSKASGKRKKIFISSSIIACLIKLYVTCYAEAFLAILFNRYIMKVLFIILDKL